MDNNRNDDGSSIERDRVYQLRRKNFQKRLVTNLSSLGYIVIVLEYLKYGCTIWTLLIRVLVQMMLAAPFPNELHIRRLASRNEIQTSSYFLSMGIPNGRINAAPRESIPGGFPSIPIEEEPLNDELQIQKDLEDIKKKIRKTIFHGSLTLNIIYIITSILFPVDFIAKLNGKQLDDDGLVDTPSPFNNANGLIDGQRKGGFLMQMLGEFLPQSNFKGNLGIILFQFGILFCQFGLFVLTCVNLVDLGFEETLP